MTELIQGVSLGVLQDVRSASPSASTFGQTESTSKSISPNTGSFAEMVADKGRDAIEAVGKAEQSSIEGIKGEAGVYEVVSTMMEAEQQLRMAVSIRDRMVQAFLEISRMQI